MAGDGREDSRYSPGNSQAIRREVDGVSPVPGSGAAQAGASRPVLHGDLRSDRTSCAVPLLLQRTVHGCRTANGSRRTSTEDVSELPVHDRLNALDHREVSGCGGVLDKEIDRRRHFEDGTGTPDGLSAVRIGVVTLSEHASVRDWADRVADLGGEAGDAVGRADLEHSQR